MKTLLRIDSSIRHNDSISRSVGDHFVARWRDRHPGGRIITRDLERPTIPHLAHSTVLAFFSGSAKGDELRLSDQLISEIIVSDELLLTCPMYNFQIPSSLKAYLDHVVRVNKTFRHNNGEYLGLLKNKRCHVITTMGGRRSKVDQEEMFESYLRNILGFMGIMDTTIYSVDGTASPEYAASAMTEVKRKIKDAL